MSAAARGEDGWETEKKEMEKEMDDRGHGATCLEWRGNGTHNNNNNNNYRRRRAGEKEIWENDGGLGCVEAASLAWRVFWEGRTVTGDGDGAGDFYDDGGLRGVEAASLAWRGVGWGQEATTVRRTDGV